MEMLRRKRKLSMSGSKAVVVEGNDGSLYGEITDSQGHCARLSFGALSLLQGLLMTAFNKRVGDMVKQSVRRRLDFNFMIETETSIEDERNDDIPCGQRSPLVKLEVALEGGYLRDGWMTSRVNDINWISEYETPSAASTSITTNYLGLSFDIGAASPSCLTMSSATYDSIRTPVAKVGILTCPQEILRIIIDSLSIRDALSLAQTCTYFNNIIDTAAFWRHRIFEDFSCYSVYHAGQASSAVLKDTYRLLYLADNDDDDDIDEEMIF